MMIIVFTYEVIFSHDFSRYFDTFVSIEGYIDPKKKKEKKGGKEASAKYSRYQF